MIATDELKKVGFKERAGSLYLGYWPWMWCNDEQTFPHVTRRHMIHRECEMLEWLTKRTARHEYFMSLTPRTYSYGNRGTGDETYASKPFEPWTLTLMGKLNDLLGTRFNVCFLNKYDDEHQHLGWHADDFPGMISEEPIAVVSFGAEREIWVKLQKEPCDACAGTGCTFREGSSPEDKIDCPQCKGTGSCPSKGIVPPEQRILLEQGSVFLMPPGYQDTHFHRIPKHSRPCGPRISLTFRSFAD